MILRNAALIAVSVLWPLTNFADHNREQLDSGDALYMGQFLGIALVCAAAVFALSQLGTRGRRSTAVTIAVAAALILFFSYSALMNVLNPAFAGIGFARGAYYAYLALLVAAPMACLRWANREVLVVLGLISGLSGIAIPGFSLAGFLMRSPDEI